MTETDILNSIKERINELVREECSGYWNSCSGCYQTMDGYNVDEYPYSKTFLCIVGSGCSECGGIGAVWHDMSNFDEIMNSIIEEGL